MEQTLPGFQISWYTKDENGNVQQNGTSNTSDVLWTQSKGTPGDRDLFLVRIVNAITEAKERNISAEQLLDKAIRFKKKMLLSNQGLIKWCSRTEIKEEFKLDIVDGFLQEINVVGSLQIKRYKSISTAPSMRKSSPVTVFFFLGQLLTRICALDCPFTLC